MRRIFCSPSFNYGSESIIRISLSASTWDRSKIHFPGARKTPIYRVWDRFQLGSCLVFLAFLYYAFHRELLNRLLLLAKRNLEGELPALELIEWFLFTAKLIVLSYLTLCWYLTLGLGAGLSHALTWLPRPDTQLRRERAYPSGQLLILALENLVKAEPAP